MAAPTTHDDLASPTGAGLLPLFSVALILAVVVIGLMIAYPGTVLVIVAMATVIAFAAGIAAFLSHLIGPDGS